MVLTPASLMYVVGKWRVQVIGAKNSDYPLSCRCLADDLISAVGKAQIATVSSSQIEPKGIGRRLAYNAKSDLLRWVVNAVRLFCCAVSQFYFGCLDENVIKPYLH
jgi:hypothetical protein